MRDSTEDFFSQNGVTPPSSTSTRLQQRRAPRPPPPPPRPRQANVAASSSQKPSGSYYSQAAPQRPAPTPKPAAPRGTGSSSYYGNSSGNNMYASNASNAATASTDNNIYASNGMKPATTSSISTNLYASSTASAPGVPTPASFYNQSATPGSNDWYTPSAATATMQPQQQLQQPMANQQPAVMQPQPQQPKVMNPYMTTTSTSLEGTMDTKGAAPSVQSEPVKRSSSFGLNMFTGGSSSNHLSTTPAPTSSGSFYKPYDPLEFENEPSLLQELDINTANIWFKTRAVLFPFYLGAGKFQNVAEIVQDNDLAGPLAFALLLGGQLLLSGKIHFGYIYGFGVFGCLSMTLILNLMSPTDAVSMWTVTSILGYALLPVNMLALVKFVLLGYLESFERLLALLCIAWCTVAATRLLEKGCNMRDQRYLLAYPIALLYSAFVMITIFDESRPTAASKIL